MGSDDSGDCTEHILLPLRSLQGYKGSHQQRCNVCNAKTTWVCRTCTTALTALWPCCPRVTKYRGKVIKHGCLAAHEADSTAVPRGRRLYKRARHAMDEECHPVEGEGEEEEAYEEEDDEYDDEEEELHGYAEMAGEAEEEGEEEEEEEAEEDEEEAC